MSKQGQRTVSNEEASAMGNINSVEDQWNKARLLKIETDLLYATERVLPLVINQALDGDVKSQKLLLDRTVPPLKAVTPPLPKGLPSGDMVSLLQSLLLAISKGDVSPTVGLDVLSMVKQVAELQEATTPMERDRKKEIAQTKSQIARLETDVATCGSVRLKQVMEKELAHQRRQLEAMYEVLD